MKVKEVIIVAKIFRKSRHAKPLSKVGIHPCKIAYMDTPVSKPKMVFLNLEILNCLKSSKIL